MTLLAGGELALLRQRLGLSLGMALVTTGLGDAAAGSGELGDLSAAARFVALDRAGVALAFGLRVVVPTAGYHDARRGTRMEPLLGAEWVWRGLLTLSTHQALSVDVAASEKTGLYYAGSYTAGVRILHKFWLGVSADTFYGVRQTDDLLDVLLNE